MDRSLSERIERESGILKERLVCSSEIEIIKKV